MYRQVYRHFTFHGFKVMLRKASCILAFKRYSRRFLESAIAFVPSRFYSGVRQDVENVPVSSKELSSYQDGHQAITLYPEDSKRTSRTFLHLTCRLCLKSGW